MRHVYQVWVLTDDLSKGGPVVEDFYMESRDKWPALFFAENFPFDEYDNCIVRIEETEIGENEEVCLDIIYERPL